MQLCLYHLHVAVCAVYSGEVGFTDLFRTTSHITFIYIASQDIIHYSGVGMSYDIGLCYR